jgi:uncharacterized protein
LRRGQSDAADCIVEPAPFISTPPALDAFPPGVESFSRRSAFMVLGILTLALSIPAAHSLKEKRGVLKPIAARLRQEFNVSVAELERQDAWQSAGLGIAMIASDGANVHGALENVVRWIERTQPHVFVSNWDIEIA